MKKRGFSLIELLIVMVIMAGLATMIIPNMSSSMNAAKFSVMQNDARNTMSLMTTKFIEEQDYFNIIEESTFKDLSDNGFSEETILDGSFITVSSGNTISLEPLDCSSGTGYLLQVENDSILDKLIEFNSCTSAKIYKVDK